LDSLLPLVSFAFVASITPGPNNVMLSASGVTFGLQRTLPHLAGVSAGFVTLLAVCGSGIGTVLVELPSATFALKIVGTLYLLYVAWLMRNALAPRSAAATTRPLTTVCGVFWIVNLPCVYTWAILGATLKRWLTDEHRRRWIGAALVVSTPAQNCTFVAAGNCTLLGLSGGVPTVSAAWRTF
jgi:threonine/homoserine/homoserine lactone efflux protein